MMLKNVPFISTDTLNLEALMSTLNELSSFSRALDLLFGQSNNSNRLLDFVYIVYLIFESAYDRTSPVRDVQTLKNRLHNRYNRIPVEGFVSEVVSQLKNAAWITVTVQEGLRVSSSGLRMMSFMFDFIQQSYSFHNIKDGIEKHKFLATLSGLKFEMQQKIGIDNEAAFIMHLHSIQTLTEEIKQNIPIYIHKDNALEEISELKVLMADATKRINEYIESENITDKIDGFRMRHADKEGVLQEAILVAQEGLSEVAKAIVISSSEVWSAGILPDEFLGNLTSKIQEEVKKEGRKRFQSAEEIVVQMDAPEGKPLAYLPVKCFGGISPANIFQTIEAAENGELGLNGSSNERQEPPDMNALSFANDPEAMTFKQVAEYENSRLSDAINHSENSYVEMFNNVLTYAILNGDKKQTLMDWIVGMQSDGRFDAIVFLDLLSYLTKLDLLKFDLGNVGDIARMARGWSFVSDDENRALISGREIVRLPSESELLQDQKIDKLKGFVRSEIGEHNTVKSAK